LAVLHKPALLEYLVKQLRQHGLGRILMLLAYLP